MNTIKVDHLERLLRIQMARFGEIIDLDPIRVTGRGAEWKATLEYEAARWHPDYLMSLAEAVGELKRILWLSSGGASAHRLSYLPFSNLKKQNPRRSTSRAASE